MRSDICLKLLRSVLAEAAMTGCSSQTFTGSQRLQGKVAAETEENSGNYTEHPGTVLAERQYSPSAEPDGEIQEGTVKEQATEPPRSDPAEDDEEVPAEVPAIISGAYLVSCGPVATETARSKTDGVPADKEANANAIGCRVEDPQNSGPGLSLVAATDLSRVHIWLELANKTQVWKEGFPNKTPSGEDWHVFVFFSDLEKSEGRLTVKIKNSGAKDILLGGRLADLSSVNTGLDDITKESSEPANQEISVFPALVGQNREIVNNSFQVYIVGNVEDEMIFPGYNNLEIEFIKNIVEEFSKENSLPLSVIHITRDQVDDDQMSKASLIIMNDLGIPYGAYNPSDQELVDNIASLHASGIPVLNIGDDFAHTATLGGEVFRDRVRPLLQIVRSNATEDDETRRISLLAGGLRHPVMNGKYGVVPPFTYGGDIDRCELAEELSGSHVFARDQFGSPVVVVHSGSEIKAPLITLNSLASIVKPVESSNIFLKNTLWWLLSPLLNSL